MTVDRRDSDCWAECQSDSAADRLESGHCRCLWCKEESVRSEQKNGKKKRKEKKKEKKREEEQEQEEEEEEEEERRRNQRNLKEKERSRTTSGTKVGARGHGRRGRIES